MIVALFVLFIAVNSGISAPFQMACMAKILHALDD